MSESPSLIVSDAHLGAAPESSERAFHEFLDYAGSHTSDLVINGDLFDFWFEYRTAVPSRHFHTVRKLAELVDAGVRVRLVGGNHDSWGGPFLSDTVGVELIDGPMVETIGGRLTYLAHGDGLGEGDLGYKMLKRVIRSRPAIAAFRHVHPDHGDALARFVSRTEAHHEKSAEGSVRAGILEDHARQVLAHDARIQLVAFGHSHVPALVEIEPGRHYVNTGDWITHCTWASVSPDGVELKRWEDRA